MIVHQKVLEPQRGPLPDGGDLGGLEVGESKRGQTPVGQGEGPELSQKVDDLFLDDEKALSHLNQIRIVLHVGARGAQVDDGSGLWALLSVSVDVGHHIVPDLSLHGLSHLKIDVVLKAAKVLYLRIGYREAQLLLRLGKGNPEPAPGSEFPPVGKACAHPGARVALYQRILVGFTV